MPAETVPVAVMGLGSDRGRRAGPGERFFRGMANRPLLMPAQDHCLGFIFMASLLAANAI